MARRAAARADPPPLHSVIHGFDVLDAMERSATGPKDRPVVEIRIERVTIHANPLAD